MLKPRIKENGLQKMPSAFQTEWQWKFIFILSYKDLLIRKNIR